MDIFVHFVQTLLEYFIEILPYLAVGFLLSGLIHEFVPTHWVEKYLGGRGIKPILYSTFTGAVLPICCLGSLPVAVSLHQKGARLGPVLAFLVATPATSITALLVCYAFLGIRFTVFIFFAVILAGIVMGVIGNFFHFQSKTRVQTAEDPVCRMKVDITKAVKTGYEGTNYYFCSPMCKETFEREPKGYVGDRGQIKSRIMSALRYAFVDMVKEIGIELLLGLILATAVASITPVGSFVGDYLSEGYGYLFSLIFGLLMYICAAGSVPLAHAFLSQGMNTGAVMVLMLIGPVTSYGTILVLWKEFGKKILFVYLTILSIMGLCLGYCFSLMSVL